MTDPLTDERIAELRELGSWRDVGRSAIHDLCDALLAARRERGEARAEANGLNRGNGMLIDVGARIERERDEARTALATLAHAAERYRDLCYSRLPRDPADDMPLDEAEKLLDAAIAAARGGA